MDPARRCALRAAPPTVVTELSEAGSAALAWSGAHYGIAWSDRTDDERVVRFVRVGADGARLGTPLRMNEDRTEAADPSVTWNGVSWVVVWSGGLHGLKDIYQGRVDPRGSAAGRPWRMTRAPDREDLQPRIASIPGGFGLAWVARTSGRRWRLYAQSLDRFDAPRGFPAVLLDTAVTLGETELVWTGAHWAVGALSAQREVLRVELGRLDPRGYGLGSVTRVTPRVIGGVESRGRYALAWDGARFAVAWSEVTGGSAHVFFQRASARGNLEGAPLDLSDADESAESPALARVGDGLVAAAWQVTREGRARIRVRTIDGAARAQESPVELQDHDGEVGRPQLVVAGDTLALLSVSSRALTLHRITLGPCPVRGY
ncbi:MAG: hypothetical protein U0325_08980 [Polyangiales bacterium]